MEKNFYQKFRPIWCFFCSRFNVTVYWREQSLNPWQFHGNLCPCKRFQIRIVVVSSINTLSNWSFKIYITWKKKFANVFSKNYQCMLHQVENAHISDSIHLQFFLQKIRFFYSCVSYKRKKITWAIVVAVSNSECSCVIFVFLWFSFVFETMIHFFFFCNNTKQLTLNQSTLPVRIWYWTAIVFYCGVCARKYLTKLIRL